MGSGKECGVSLIAGPVSRAVGLFAVPQTVCKINKHPCNARFFCQDAARKWRIEPLEHLPVKAGRDVKLAETLDTSGFSGNRLLQ
jgi:hypothetical protein